MIQAYPGNGYMALFTGLSQFENGDEARAAETLGALAATLSERREALASAGDRFDLYYTWGRALLNTDQDDLAFEAFREAINNDPRASRDETLWAKFRLATLYDRRGLTETARQMLCTLLRGPNVEDLHRQAENRLGSRTAAAECGGVVQAETGCKAFEALLLPSPSCCGRFSPDGIRLAAPQ